MRPLLVVLTGCVVIVGATSCGSKLPDPGPMPPGATFAGVWDSNWGQMRLMQQGGHVHGTFQGFRSGSLSGDANGNLYVFRWTEYKTSQLGRGYLVMSPDGKALEGRWGYQKEYSNGGRWWATRATDAEPVGTE